MREIWGFRGDKRAGEAGVAGEAGGEIQNPKLALEPFVSLKGKLREGSKIQNPQASSPSPLTPHLHPLKVALIAVILLKIYSVFTAVNR